LLPSFMYIRSTTLPNLSIPDVHFTVPLIIGVLHRSGGNYYEAENKQRQRKREEEKKERKTRNERGAS